MADASATVSGNANNYGNTSRKCWATARERNRMRARYAIRQRVFQNGSWNDVPVGINENGAQSLGYGESSVSNEALKQNCQNGTQSIEKVQEIIRRIVRGDTSYFSVLFMEENFSILNDPFPVMLLWEASDVKGLLLEHQRLCSRLGKDGLTQLHTYLTDLETSTILEYAVWLRRYRIIRQLILGGINPTISGKYVDHTACDLLQHKNLDLKNIGALIQKQFFAGFVPLSLSSYIVNRVIGLRRSSWMRKQCMDPSILSNSTKCDICCQQMDPYLLLVLSSDTSDICCPFDHLFCERCLWMDIAKHLYNRLSDVVECPLCCTVSLNNAAVRTDDLDGLSRQRYQESLRRYNDLPLDSSTIKKISYKKKHIPEGEMMCSTWSQAVKPSLGLTQTARRDKFLVSAERGSYHYVKGCLDAGVDVNVQNEYGQTALMIAVWRNNAPIVQLLLDYGSNPFIPANGNVTCWDVATRRKYHEILVLLRMAGAKDDTSSLLISYPADGVFHFSSSSFNLLINWSSDHPGAGSFILDDFFEDPFLDSLVELWSSLPLEFAAKKKAGPCSVRSYYCDVDGTISAALCSALTKAAVNLNLPFTVDACGPQMRFLSYSECGAILAPHIDLSRTDPNTETRSTHSFLFYLTTCMKGGETSLIGDVTGENRNLVLATVAPKRGRLLVFPHRCPHEGLSVVDTPKVLIRGELWLRTRIDSERRIPE